MKISAVQIKSISTKNRSRSGAVAACPNRRDFSLIFLQTDFHVSITLIPSTVHVRWGFHAITTFPIQQFAVYILYRVNLQLEIARGLGDLKIKKQKGRTSLTVVSWGGGGRKCMEISKQPLQSFQRQSSLLIKLLKLYALLKEASERGNTAAIPAYRSNRKAGCKPRKRPAECSIGS